VAASETQLIQRWLGVKPFALIELDGTITGPGEDDFEIKMEMTFGGGIGKSGALGVLAQMLEENGWSTTAPDGFDPDADD
jgi:hypothetical protein